MSKFLVAAFAMLLVVTVGCQSNKDDSMNGKAMKSSSMDACPQCPGKQTASADGTCPVCKMQVSSMSGADACPKCPGVQTVKADGTCSGCGAMVARQ